MQESRRAITLAIAAMLIAAPQAGIAQTAGERIGTVDSNQVLAVARSASSPDLVRQAIVRSISAKLDARQAQIRADTERLQRDAGAIDQTAFRQREAAIRQSTENLSRQQAELNTLVKTAANTPPRDPGGAAVVSARLAIGAAAVIEDIDVVIETPIYSRAAVDLTSRVVALLRGQ
jgi:Skp family chaperone for outer membrane proteins